LGMSLLVIHDAGPPTLPAKRRKVVDVWWRGRDNGSLMLILAYLLTLNQEWTGASIRVLRAVADEAGRAEAERDLTGLIESARIEVEAHVIVSRKPLHETLYEYSHRSTAVFLGFRIPEVENAERFQQAFSSLLEGLPTTLLVHSTGEADLTS
ncbi:MAG: hypothetical protein GF331_09850, partial [Chitinivibrionales bacterium]|nr:hypothetical protein [Chitinivibrionales bacterium]